MLRGVTGVVLAADGAICGDRLVDVLRFMLRKLGLAYGGGFRVAKLILLLERCCGVDFFGIYASDRSAPRLLTMVSPLTEMKLTHVAGIKRLALGSVSLIAGDRFLLGGRAAPYSLAGSAGDIIDGVHVRMARQSLTGMLWAGSAKDGVWPTCAGRK